MFIRKLPAAAAALSLIGLAAPVAGASAATTPAVSLPATGASPLLTFVPPSVGPLVVSLGATIIGGKVISPGLNVSTPGITLPPLSWTPPAVGTPLP
jgi:hypothetical protein